MDMKFVLTSV